MEVEEVLREGADVVEATDADSKEMIPNYHENPLDVLEACLSDIRKGRPSLLRQSSIMLA